MESGQHLTLESIHWYLVATYPTPQAFSTVTTSGARGPSFRAYSGNAAVSDRTPDQKIILLAVAPTNTAGAPKVLLLLLLPSRRGKRHLLHAIGDRVHGLLGCDRCSRPSRRRFNTSLFGL